MPTQLKQSPQHPSGTAAFVVMGPAARQVESLDGVQLSIVQTGQVDRYLDPRMPSEPWSTAVYRFYPRNPVRDEKTLSMEIDEGVTYHLGANQPYKLLIWRPDAKEIVEVFTYPGGIRQVSRPPADWQEPPQPGQEPVRAAPLVERVAEPAAVLPDHAAQEAAEQAQREARERQAGEAALRAQQDAEAHAQPAATAGPGKPGKGRWIGLAIALLALAGGAAWYWQQGGTPPEPQAQPASAATPTPATACQDIKDLDAARACLRGDPEPAAARAAAEALAASGGGLELQLMLYKYAGDKGDTVAARMMGSFNDPDTWSEKTSPMPAPNGNAAARWYRIAADAGDAESQYRYGMLLKKGRTDDADGPEQAVGWLQKAAGQGHEAAKKEVSP